MLLRYHISKDVYHQNVLSQLSYKVYHDNCDTLKLCVPPCSKSRNDKGISHVATVRQMPLTQMTNYLFAV